MMRRTLTLFALALALGAATVANAQGDLRAFNTAVEAGDYRGASLVAAEAWPEIDAGSPDAVAITREFGWIAMLADEPSTALNYARFLVEQGQSLPHPDTNPAVSRVLFDWAALAISTTSQTRSQLMASLNARAAVTGRDLISARAAQVLYAQASRVEDWPQASQAAALAVRFLDEAGATQSPARFEMRRGMATAAFLQASSPEAYNAMYDVVEELHDLIAATPDGSIRDRLASEYFMASAWGDVMYSALGERVQRSVPDRRATAGANRKPIAELLYPAPGDVGLPRCRIALARNFRQPGFPFEARFKDFGGIVIYALNVEPNGQFSEPRLLVSAPHDGVASVVEDVIRSWRWRIDSGPQPPACRMPETHILTFEFALGR